MCKKSPVFVKKNANYACYAFFGLYPCFVPKFSNFANYAGTVFSKKKLSKKVNYTLAISRFCVFHLS